MPLGKVQILGLEKSPSIVKVNGDIVKFKYDPQLRNIQIDTKIDLGKEFKVEWT